MVILAILLAISSIANVVLAISLYKWFMKYHGMLDEQLAKWKALAEQPDASKSVKLYARVRIRELDDAGADMDTRLSA